MLDSSVYQDFKDCLWSRAIFDFPWSWAFGNLSVFEKANLAKLVMHVSAKEGEPEPVWNQDFKDRLWSWAVLDIFGSEPAHVPFTTENKHKGLKLQ